MLAGATTPSYATTITYNFAARIDVAVAPTPDFPLETVQTGDVLHGTMTINTSLPDLNASPDLGQYVATWRGHRARTTNLTGMSESASTASGNRKEKTRGIDVRVVEQIGNTANFARSDRVLIAHMPSTANAASGSAGAAVTVSITGLELPSSYSVQATPSQAAIVSVSGKSYSGLTVTLTPLSGSVTLSAGTVDITVLA